MRLRLVKIAIAILLVMPICGMLDDDWESLGNGYFIYRDRRTFAGHSATRSSLRHWTLTLTPRLSDAAVNPHRPTLILYSTYDPDGTFYYDAATGRRARIGERTLNVGENDIDPTHPAWLSRWSPDGKRVFLDEMSAPYVLDLASGEHVLLPAAVGGANLRAWAWSPSGRRIAAVTEVERDMQTQQDLVAIDVDDLSVEYVATIRSGATRGTTLWYPQNFRWDGECLRTTDARSVNRIEVLPKSARWVRPMREAGRRTTDCG